MLKRYFDLQGLPTLFIFLDYTDVILSSVLSHGVLPLFNFYNTPYFFLSSNFVFGEWVDLSPFLLMLVLVDGLNTPGYVLLVRLQEQVLHNFFYSTILVS